MNRLIESVIRYVNKHLEEAGGMVTSLLVWDAGFFSFLFDGKGIDDHLFLAAATALLTGFFGGLGGLLIRLIGRKFKVKEKA